MYQVPTDMRF